MATAFSWLNSALLSKIFAAVCHALTLRLRGYRKFYVTMVISLHWGRMWQKTIFTSETSFSFCRSCSFHSILHRLHTINRSTGQFVDLPRGMQSDWNELKQPTINICNLASPLAFGLVAVCKTPLFWACLIIFGVVSWKKNFYLRHMPRAGYILSPTI